ncbi:MAG: pantoate--beta-alanine ligase [Solirubrobacterales bacterium]
MKVVRTPEQVREAVGAARAEGLSIGLVPTMGAFHRGHLELMAAAGRACDTVVVSLFVNPTQFGAGEDLDGYPRAFERDRALAEEAGADVLYAPEPGTVYPPGFCTWVEVHGLTDVLCGDPAHRGAEHFRGVTTVVTKLLNTVAPDRAFFGQKDAQQALVLRRMVRDLDIPTAVDLLPTVREPDGLAMSSRNAYLSDADRDQALALSRGLRAAEQRAHNGETDTAQLVRAAETELAPLEVEYLEARDAEDLSPASTLNGRPVLLAVAARVGPARLIDNVIIPPNGGVQ